MRCLLLLAAGIEASQSLRDSKIEPALHPESDEKFFDKDYPNDMRPKVTNMFDHPYPSVQAAADYDADYVKDENHDDGYWAIQMEYDRLKNKLAREKDALAKAKAKMEEEKWEYEQVKKFEAEAEAAARDAEGKSAGAAGAAANAEGAAGDQAGQIDGATGDVEKETDNLKGCEEQLAKAKEALENLKGELNSAEGGAASAYGDFSKAEEVARQLEAQEAALEKQVEADMLSYDQLVKMYKIALKELEQLEADVHAAAMKLKKFHAMEPNERDGIVSLNSKKSGANYAFPSAAVMGAFAAWSLC
jgi:chromosome segregation ATPase